jgi:hypothetical protein
MASAAFGFGSRRERHRWFHSEGGDDGPAVGEWLRSVVNHHNDTWRADGQPEPAAKHPTRGIAVSFRVSPTWPRLRFHDAEAAAVAEALPGSFEMGRATRQRLTFLYRTLFGGVPIPPLTVAVGD